MQALSASICASLIALAVSTSASAASIIRDDDCLHALEAPGTQARVDALAHATTKFGLALYGELDRVPGNVFLSPYSLEAALAMTLAGARGETATSIAATLRVPPAMGELHGNFHAFQARVTCKQDAAFTLETANAVWAQDGHAFATPFMEVVSRDYAATVRTLDFQTASEAARAAINSWTAEQTHGRIQDLLQAGALSAATRLIMTNAIYYKGVWINPFKPEATKAADFHLADGTAVRVPTMHQLKRLLVGETDEATAVALPFLASKQGVSSAQSLVVLLPKAGRTVGDVAATLDADAFVTLWDRMELSWVDLALPKFKFSSGLGLKKALSALGMAPAFTPGEADFSGMLASGARDLFLSDVVHQAHIDVNENGAEAAAATATGVEATSASSQGLPLSVDRPFLFMIVDETTKAILFMGRVADPRS